MGFAFDPASTERASVPKTLSVCGGEGFAGLNQLAAHTLAHDNRLNLAAMRAVVHGESTIAFGRAASMPLGRVWILAR